MENQLTGSVRWARIDELFHAAVAHPPDARKQFLVAHCGNDSVLQAEVESLLSAHREGGASVVGARLPVGSRFGAYEVTGFIAAGGMGEVYRARDSKLGRDVALKILPGLHVADPDRRARFEREARLLASLNHPHIATIYGFEEQDGVQALALELIDGETLAARIARGRLALDEALRVARQIADALDAAHQHGIIHRDLKPANITLVRDGHVKVLDFGLAKLGQPEDGTDAPALSVTGQKTMPGVLLGTPAYMSPEQARGERVDKRTDIWAFGCVLYELLAGQPTFPGHTISDTIAKILECEPAWDALPAATPSSIRNLLRRCLQKDASRRLRDIGDARIELDEVQNLEASAPKVASGAPSSAAHRIGRAALVLVVLLAIAIPSVLSLRRSAPGPPVTRLDVVTPATDDAASFELSPDGRKLVFVANGDNGSQLWLRPLDQATAQPLAGTDEATSPFWSPDSSAIGFFADRKLKRLDVPGGAPHVIADAADARGGTWNADGLIVFAPAVHSSALMRVVATGGTPQPMTGLLPSDQECTAAWPQFLPDGHRFLYVRACKAERQEAVYLASLDGGEPTRLIDGHRGPSLFAPPDRLLFERQGALFAVHFDLARGAVAGEPVLVAQPVRVETRDAGRAAVSTSANGMLAYRTGAAAARRQLIWVDRAGKTLSDLSPPDDRGLAGPALTRDGLRAAVTRAGRPPDVWMIEVARGIISRLTLDGGAAPVWSPDGSRMIFRSDRKGRNDLFEKFMNGSEEREVLVTPQDKQPLDWSLDGRLLLYASNDPQSASDLWALPLTGERKPLRILQTRFVESQGQFSPDAKWIAYASNETGRLEIYVQAFPEGGKWQVSTGGGVYPRWRPDGQELFYVATDNRLMAVPMRFAPDGRRAIPGAAVALFQTRLATGGNTGVEDYSARAQYAVTADGRFLMNVIVEDQVPPITIVQNWTADLKR